MYTIKDLYDLDHTLAKDYLSQFTYPWEALKGIKDMIIALGATLGDDYVERAPQVWVHKTAKVFDSAFLGAPASSAPTPRCASAPLSAVRRWSALTASSATPPS